MAIDFPDTPNDGDSYTAGGRTWVYDSAVPAWQAQSVTNHATTHAAGGTDEITPSSLNLEIGVDVQAYDAELTTWAGVTPGSGVATFLATPSSANLAAALTDETGTGAAVFASAPSLTNPTVTNYTEGVVAIGNSGTSQTIALTSGTFQTCTLTGNCTFTMPTATAGKSFILKLLTGAGSYTAAFTGVKWPGATAPTITATASKFDLISFVADGTDWSGSILQNYSA